MDDNDYREKIKHLSAEELRFLRLKCAGHKMDSIFNQLNMSGGNRFDFQKNIFRKLGAENKFDAGDYWEEHGPDICAALETPPSQEPPKQELPVAPQPGPPRNPLLYATSAVVLLCLCLSVAGVAAWRLLDIPGLLTRPTPPPVAQLPTDIPAPVVTPTPIVIVVTATAPPAVVLATDIPAPTAIPTNTDIPFTPTATEEVNTPAGTILEVGDVWKQDGVYLWLTKVEPKIFSGEPRLRLSFDVANYTGQDISVSFDLRNVTLETNMGNVFESKGKLEYGLLWQKTIPNGTRQSVLFFSSPEIDFVGDYLSPAVTEVLVTVRGWGRIEEAIWQVDIAH